MTPRAPYGTKTATERVRGRKLQRIRDRLFRANPLCVMCTARGMDTVAVELDHVVALANGGTNEESNYQCLCAVCHAEKTAIDLGYRRKPVIGLDGWPIDVAETP